MIYVHPRRFRWKMNFFKKIYTNRPYVMAERPFIFRFGVCAVDCNFHPMQKRNVFSYLADQRLGASTAIITVERCVCNCSTFHPHSCRDSYRVVYAMVSAQSDMQIHDMRFILIHFICVFRVSVRFFPSHPLPPYPAPPRNADRANIDTS